MCRSHAHKQRDLRVIDLDALDNGISELSFPPPFPCLFTPASFRYAGMFAYRRGEDVNKILRAAFTRRGIVVTSYDRGSVLNWSLTWI